MHMAYEIENDAGTSARRSIPLRLPETLAISLTDAVRGLGSDRQPHAAARP
jgi:hypothetical protein